jgi:hypothetical protein
VKNGVPLAASFRSRPPEQPVETFDYIYKILNLIYITSIENSIYNLDYDLTAQSTPIVASTNSYAYEKEKIFSWF